MTRTAVPTLETQVRRGSDPVRTAQTQVPAVAIQVRILGLEVVTEDPKVYIV